MSGCITLTFLCGVALDLELEFTLDVGYRLFDTLDDTAIMKHENGYTVKLTLPENNWLGVFDRL